MAAHRRLARRAVRRLHENLLARCRARRDHHVHQQPVQGEARTGVSPRCEEQTWGLLVEVQALCGIRLLLPLLLLLLLLLLLPLLPLLLLLLLPLLLLLMVVIVFLTIKRQ